MVTLFLSSPCLADPAAPPRGHQGPAWGRGPPAGCPALGSQLGVLFGGTVSRPHFGRRSLSVWPGGGGGEASVSMVTPFRPCLIAVVWPRRPGSEIPLRERCPTGTQDKAHLGRDHVPLLYASGRQMKNEVRHETFSAGNKGVLLTFSREFCLSQDKVI